MRNENESTERNEYDEQSRMLRTPRTPYERGFAASYEAENPYLVNHGKGSDYMEWDRGWTQAHGDGFGEELGDE